MLLQSMMSKLWCREQVIVGQNAIMATPAMSALIRRRGLYGARPAHCPQ